MIRTPLVIALLSTALVAPLVASSPAHPDTHNYYGSALLGAATVSTDQLKVDFDVDISVTGACWDMFPLLRPGVPPTPVRDLDPDFGVAGGCFPFETTAGSDTGTTPLIYVSEGTPSSVVWVACVDVDGNGICSSSGADEFNLCSTGAGHTGSESLLSPGQACLVYANPAAALPALFVVMVGTLSADGTTVSGSQPVFGGITLF